MPDDAAISAGPAQPQATLEYESAGASALVPGEQVWWEGSPQVPVSADHAKRAFGWTVGIAFAVCAALLIWQPGQVYVILGLFVAPAAVVLVGLICWHEYRSLNRRAVDTLYRVTDQRIIRVSGSRRDDIETMSNDEVTGFLQITFPPGKASDIVIHTHAMEEMDYDGYRGFTGVGDADGLARVLAELPARTGRRARLRRGSVPRPSCSMEPSPTQPPAQTMPHPDSTDPSASAADLALLNDEILLWTGRPRVWRALDRYWAWRKVRAILWLLIPLSLILAWLGSFGERATALHWLIVVGAGVWLAMGLYLQLVWPFLEAWRRARTHYCLTNIRAITIHSSGNRRSVTSVFLDLAGGATLTENPDGAGDVTLTMPHCHFKSIENAQQVYDRLLAAIRSAGLSPRDIAAAEHLSQAAQRID